MRSTLPKDPGRVVALQLARANWPFREHRPVEALRALFAAGVRWHTSPVQEIANARRDLLRCGDYLFADLMKLLATGGLLLAGGAHRACPHTEHAGTHEEGRPDPGDSALPERVRPGSASQSQGSARQARGRAAEAEGGEASCSPLPDGADRRAGAAMGASSASTARRSSSASGPCRWRRWRRSGACQAAGSPRPAGAFGFPFRRAATGRGWRLVSDSAARGCRVLPPGQAEEIVIHAPRPASAE